MRKKSGRKRERKANGTGSGVEEPVSVSGEGGAGDAAAIPSDPTQPNLAETIARVTEERAASGGDAPRRRGRPPGSKTRKPRAAAEDDGPAEVTETDIVAAAGVGRMVWKLAGKMLKLRELDDSESRELGESLAPVVAKYLPMLNEYGAEIALGLCVFGLYEKTREKPPAAVAAPPAP